MESIHLPVKDLRHEYGNRGLHKKDLHPNPFQVFVEWFKEAKVSGTIEPNAFFLATATPNGHPSCRAVLMKHFDEEGLFFFTNYGSRKAIEITANPYVAATFWWSNIERQVRIEGYIEKTSEEISTRYFSQRPRKSQLGAWASMQGIPLPSKAPMEEKYKQYEEKFEKQEVPCPPYWGGYRIIPTTFEFWQGSEARLHDRFLYLKEKDTWSITRLSP